MSPVIGASATGFTALMIPVLCLPPTVGENLDPSVMNWTCLVWGTPMLGAMVWWVLSANKWFKGPKVNIKHAMLGREGNVVFGKGVDGVGSDADYESRDGYVQVAGGDGTVGGKDGTMV